MLPRHPTEIEWSDSLLPPPSPSPLTPAVVARVRSLFGPIPPWIPSLQWCPWVVETIVDACAIRPVHFDFDLVALLHLVIAQENSCRYCYGTARVMLQILGFSEDAVRSLERDMLAARISPRNRAALDYARQLSRADPRPGAAQARVLAQYGFDEAAVAELAAFTAMWLTATRITTLFAIPPAADHAPTNWWMRLTRPIVARTLRRQGREFPSAVPDPAKRITAFDPLIATLGALPAGASLRKILDEAFGDGPLPRRTRLIVGAVIGRALGCDITLQLLQSLLAADGVEPPAVEAMLARLDADWLDEREHLLLRAARDTVHIHQPLTVQRRMSEVRERLAPAEFIDFVGVASVANGLARLGVLLQRC